MSMETKADWLRSEIEKLEIEKKQVPYTYDDDMCQALISIITRYKEELLELEKGV